ncbi:hypothetical protein D3C71_1551140 [compost metagenome]
MLAIEQGRRGITDHARHLRIRIAARHQRTPCGVGTVGRQFPVTEITGAGVWLGIGVAADADLVRHRLDGVGHGQQDVFEIRLQASRT